MKFITLKDKAREDLLIRSRLLMAMVVVLVLVSILISRLVYLQVISHDHYITLSQNNRVNIEPVAPIRGLIRDRNGVVLAQNRPTFSLEIVPEDVPDLDATLDELAALLALSPQDLKRFEKLRRQKRRFEKIPLRSRLSEAEVARFAVNRHRFPGVDVAARLTRQYPLAEITSHVVGYVGRINERELPDLDPTNYSATTHIGKTGVEKAYEGVLHGQVGYRHVETNATGRILRVLKSEPPVPGYDIDLYLDAGLQRVAERALGEERGSVVAIDPATGGVLAMVSKPGFDPNLFVHGIGRKDYAALRDSPDRPLFNRALRGQYPPGSTLKPFVALAGLQYNLKLAHGHTWCRGWFQLPGKEHKYRDWKKQGHGKVDLNWAILRSCDVYFYELALELGIDHMHDFLAQFGFGRPTGIDIGGEVSGILPSRAWKRRTRNQPWYPGETLIAGIGQGFNLATPLQLAMATATLASRGVVHHPQVASGLMVDGKPAPQQLAPAAAEPVRLKKDAYWDETIKAMQDVVHATRGTAHRIASGIDYTMAGKTGTAQVFGIKQDEKYEAHKLNKRLHDHALFIAFAPVEAPRIAVAVLVENGGSGSKSAAPVARKVIDHYLGKDPVDTAMDDSGAAMAGGYL